jgi:hypothetical protein
MLAESGRLGEVTVNDVKEQGAKMNKSELKTGMVVVYRDGDRRLVIGETLYVMEENHIWSANSLGKYSVDMISTSERDLDIVEVFSMDGSRIYLRSEATYKELTPHEAMIKLMDDGEFKCELKDNSEWIAAKLAGVKPQKPAPFISMGDNHFFKCRIKEEV